MTFDEITKKGVKEGMAHPRAIDEDLFNAQQARRVLDRLVGYKLSPFLWRKVRRGLSAGRVQSVAVRIIDDREKEIEAFKPEEYWNVDATLGVGRKSFTARLASDDKGKKLLPHSEAEARAIRKGPSRGPEYTVGELKKASGPKQPTPAFITSTLQQEASRRLGFTATRHHARCPDPVRRRGHCGPRHHGSDHLYAYRQPGAFPMRRSPLQRSILRTLTANSISAPTSALGRPRAPRQRRTPMRPSVPLCRA